MRATGREQAIQKYIEAYNAFSVDGMPALLSPDLRFENWSGARLTAEASGIEEFRQLAERAKAMFSEREQRITGIEQGADSVIVRIAYCALCIADNLPWTSQAGRARERCWT